MNINLFLMRLKTIFHKSGVTANTTLIEDAAHALRHEMNVLGSGWIKNHYGMRTAGFEGHNYSDETVTYEAVLASLPYRPAVDPQTLFTPRQVVGEAETPYQPIDWQIDLKSGARYDMILSKDIRFGIQEGVDAKMTADMNRLYPLVTLAKAYAVTGNFRYLNEACRQFADWVTMNPVGYGAAWRGNMNVAIRAVNLPAAFALLADGLDAVRDASLIERLYASLVEHRRYIAENLEFTELPSALHPNHYIANLSGLLVLSALLSPTDSESAAWERLAARELRLTFDWQINSDGVDFEATTMYHAFAIEMLTYAGLLTARLHGGRTAEECRIELGKLFGETRMPLFAKMFAALSDMIAPNGLLPVVGDADSGRFLYLEADGTPDRDRRFLLPVGAALFGTKDIAGIDNCDDGAARIFFDDRIALAASLPAASAAYPISGFYILRTPQDYAFVCCAPIGTGGLGSHAHNDRLEVLLNVAGHDIVIDPGVYAYTASRYWRNLYRNAGVHATVKLGGLEPNRLNPPEAWWGYRDDTKCRALNWMKDGFHTVFCGEQYAYQRLEHPVTHRRTVDMRPGQLQILDEFTASDVAADYAFTLDPQVHVRTEDGAILMETGDICVRLSTKCGKITVGEGYYAPVYGANAPTTALSIHLDRLVPINELLFTW